MVFTRKDGIFMGYVSFREGNPQESLQKHNKDHGSPRTLVRGTPHPSKRPLTIRLGSRPPSMSALFAIVVV